MTRPPLKVLRFLTQVTPDHIVMLRRLEREVPECYSVDMMLMNVLQNRSWLWEVEGKKGLVITEIHGDDPDKELYIYGIVGSGMIRLGKEIASDLTVIARSYNCKEIGGRVMRPGLERFYKDVLNAQRKYVYYTLEV